MLKKSVIVHALAIAFGGAALTVGLIEPAMAQSNASAVIYGSVTNPAGATVTLTNTDTEIGRAHV